VSLALFDLTAELAPGNWAVWTLTSLTLELVGAALGCGLRAGESGTRATSSNAVMASFFMLPPSPFPAFTALPSRTSACT